MKKLSIILLMLSAVIYSQTDSLQIYLNNILKRSFFDTCQISISVYNLTKDTPVFVKNENLLMRPASNLKLVTTSAGLVFLGPDYKFRTKILGSEIKDSILKGNLYVKGGFDPDFSLEDMQTIVDNLKANGIKRIEGKIIGDISAKDSLFFGNGWMWDDEPSTDMPYLSPLILNRDMVTVIIMPSKPGMRAKVKVQPGYDYFTIDNSVIATNKDLVNVSATRDWLNRKNVIKTSGTIGSQSKTVYKNLNVYNSSDYFISYFKTILKERGISFTESPIEYDITPKNLNLITEIAHSFDSIIVNLNKNSDNLSAEMTLYALGSLHKVKNISAEDGVKFSDSLLTLCGLKPTNYSIVDGSGLSHYNLISAKVLLSVLKYIYAKPSLFKVLYNSLPIGGIDGTLKNRMKDELVLNNVHAKTGTISGVSTLSGYLKTKAGDDIAFSIMIQNFIGSSSSARGIQDEICRYLVKFGSN